LPSDCPSLAVAFALVEVSRALGHASIATRANVYGHFTKTMAERSADRITGILGRSARG
jgi:hypothetical protein